MKNSQKDFVNEYKKLEAILKKLSKANDSAVMRDIIEQLSRNHYLISSKKDILLNLSALRNIFMHSDREKYIAKINQLAFDEMLEITKLLEKPPIVGKVFQKNVYFASNDEVTETVIRTMREKNYTHVPIYKQNSTVYSGCFSETTLLEWLDDNISNGHADFYKKRIKDVNVDYLGIDTNIIKFISSNTSIFDVAKKFSDAIHNQNRLGAIIITKTGKRNELPQGIITAWDLPLIDKYLNTKQI